jgi:tRNA pseudouridine32 synthase/23S rRNA pseudouridine746 synthase
MSCTPSIEQRLIYLDEDLLVLDKPAGMLCVPGRGPDKQDCMSARVQARWPGALTVHRLDMATSGLLLMARNPHCQRQLSRAFEARQIHKHYVAIVHGQLQADATGQGLIDLPLAVDWPRRPLQKVDLQLGKPSQTRWQILQRADHTTRLLLQPLSGRTHQLRVHLQAIGHPIVGDALYGDDAGPQAPRLLLHASALMLTHPISGRSLHLQSAPPF